MGDGVEPLTWAWWGTDLPYREAWERQRAARERVIATGRGEVLGLLEHRSVVTVGRRPTAGTPSPEALAALGVDHVVTERGGLATWHGPGQLVGYLVVDVWGRGLGVKGFVRRVEEGLIRWLATQGLSAGRRSGHPGVWVGPDKVAAVGLHLRRGVSMHGFALNLSGPLAGFDLIVPCGLAGAGVTSVERLGGPRLTPAEASASVATALLDVLHGLDGSFGSVRNGPSAGTTAAGA